MTLVSDAKTAQTPSKRAIIDSLAFKGKKFICQGIFRTKNWTVNNCDSSSCQLWKGQSISRDEKKKLLKVIQGTSFQSFKTPLIHNLTTWSSLPCFSTKKIFAYKLSKSTAKYLSRISVYLRCPLLFSMSFWKGESLEYFLSLRDMKFPVTWTVEKIWYEKRKEAMPREILLPQMKLRWSDPIARRIFCKCLKWLWMVMNFFLVGKKIIAKTVTWHFLWRRSYTTLENEIMHQLFGRIVCHVWHRWDFEQL